MISDYAIAAVQEVLDRTPGVDIVYVHRTPGSPAVAAIVRAGTPAYGGNARCGYAAMIASHDHIEPGMW